MRVKIHQGDSYLRIGLACCLAFSLTCCTLISVDGAESVKIAAPGVIMIVPAPGVEAVTYRLEGIGLVPGFDGATLGYRSEEAAFIYDPDSCRIIILELPNDDASVPFRRDLLSERKDICAVKGE